MHIPIMKIKNHKKINNYSFKFKKYYFLGNIIMSKIFLKIYLNFERKKMLSFHCLQGSIIMLSPNK